MINLPIAIACLVVFCVFGIGLLILYGCLMIAARGDDYEEKHHGVRRS